MNASPDDPGAEGRNVRAVHIDHAQGTQVGDHGTQDNRLTKVTAGRDVQSAGGDFYKQELHLHFGNGDGAATGDFGPGDVTTPVLPGASRLAYLEQVRRIAPPDPPGLKDREAELAELARFCLDSDALPYVWWQAGAWAGKSALLSTFVLHPPSSLNARVQILSFFITARLAAQDNRDAFTQVMLEQLAELTGQMLPAVLPEATRDSYLLSLLAQAAIECQQADGRLVLVLDGLDEDRGVTTGPHAHSIAGLLPADPPAGMRVIVAGRPNPPIPDDVPDWHPLRDPTIIRPLTSSPHARDVQRLSRQELHGLLTGGAAGRNLLGLLTAARGGLSGLDLADLAGVSLWEVEDVLHTVAGRTFTRRASRWAPDTGPEVYLLSHEELQVVAARYLADRLPAYRDQLHHWCDAYLERGWPPETPEYLFSGYFRLLTALEDVHRMITCAIDTARHDRMLLVTGGDGAALAEVRTVLDHIVGQEAPDASRALAVARHRDLLADRNSRIPLELPAVWAAVGQVTRAEALATSVTDPHWKANALVLVAGVMFKAGRHQQATTITVEAETAARTIANPHWQAEALALVAGVMFKAGRHQQATTITVEAETVARIYVDPQLQVRALGRIAEVLADAGQYQRAAMITAEAETTARTVANPRDQVWALTSVAAALTKAGQQQQAAGIAAQAEISARAITNPQERAVALTSVVEALANAGRNHDAEAIALEISDPRLAARALTELAKALGEAGDGERAAAIVMKAESKIRDIADPQVQEYNLAQLAEALSGAGQYQPAEAIAQVITDRQHQATAVASVAEALAKEGRHQDAENIALTISDPGSQAESMTKIAAALSDAGKREEAVRVALRAETAARSVIDQGRQAIVLAVVANAFAEAGQRDEAVTIAVRAETAARSITDTWDRVEALAFVAEALAEAGQRDEAVTIAVQAETAAHSIINPQQQSRALVLTARALVAAGECQRARTMAYSITDPEIQLEALAQIAGALSLAGDYEEAVRIAVHAETLAQSGTSPRARAVALAESAWNLARAGQREQAAAQIAQAESIAQSITDRRFERVRALPYIAGAMAANGQYEEAEAIARSIVDYPDQRDSALALVVDAMVRAGHCHQAEVVARGLTDPEDQAAAFSQIAEALAETGEALSASRLVAEACAIGSWFTPVAAILKLNPSASATVVSMLNYS